MVGAGSAQQAKGGEARTEKAPLPVDGCGGDVLAEVRTGTLLPDEAHEVEGLASAGKIMDQRSQGAHVRSVTSPPKR